MPVQLVAECVDDDTTKLAIFDLNNYISYFDIGVAVEEEKETEGNTLILLPLSIPTAAAATTTMLLHLQERSNDDVSGRDHRLNHNS